MNLKPFHQILNKAMGLSPDSLGRSGISHAINKRMRETGCNEQEYLYLIRNDDNEKNALIEEVVVPETWFFRDTRPFDLLFETVFKCKECAYRVLSAPCSTGEEPYSIAMTLRGAGLAPDKIKIHAVDISQKAINKAKRGLYRENSFRSSLPVYAENCFKKNAHGRQLIDEVRSSVKFHTGNIVEGELPAGKYDAIFCRNLLIYLDDKSKETLARQFSEKLKDGGLLFVGHAELLPVFFKWFTPLRKPGAFAMRKGEHKISPLLQTPAEGSNCDCVKTTAKNKPVKWPVKPEPASKPDSRPQVSSKSVQRKTAAETARPHTSLSEIKRQADLGHITKAMAMCDSMLAQQGPDAELMHLYGLLHEAQNNISTAEEYYGKALYLEPDHIESLVHLALLLDTKGETRKAQLLRNRLLRAEKS